MVSIQEVQASNSRISTDLPPGLIAVFVGATSGIGEASLKAFAKHARKPRVYFVGRSQEAGERIEAECKELNPDGSFTFMQADASLLRNVDEICRQIKQKEDTINLLFLSMGTFMFYKETSEGLHSFIATAHYGRARFIANLLPQLQRARTLRRVVSVLTGTHEGTIHASDLQAWRVPFVRLDGHVGALVTLGLEALARRAPDVAFVHDHPGPVLTNLARPGQGALVALLNVIVHTVVRLPFVGVPIAESGARHLHFATSARYGAKERGREGADGVPLVEGAVVARGTSGDDGSGTYSVDWRGESAGPKVEALLERYRKEGLAEKVWENVEEEFVRITGSRSVE